MQPRSLFVINIRYLKSDMMEVRIARIIVTPRPGCVSLGHLLEKTTSCKDGHFVSEKHKNRKFMYSNATVDPTLKNVVSKISQVNT